MNKILNVAIIGEPNAGKSTLLNKIVGENISIITHKVQTTRDVIRGIVTIDNTQLILMDTPGIFDAQKALEKSIVSNALSALMDAQLACIIFDLKALQNRTYDKIIQAIEKLNIPVFAVINKIDLIKKEDVLPLMAQINSEYNFAEIVPISALKGEGVEKLVKLLCHYAVEGMHYYYDGEITDRPVRFLCEEITRKHAFLMLHQEIPYSLKVETEKWEETDERINIYQAIYVLKDSQKVIALGKGGSKIKMIGTAARLEIKKLMQKPVSLHLYIKVRENWIEKDLQK